MTRQGEQVLILAANSGLDYEAPSPGKRRTGSRQGRCIDPVERGIQFIEGYPVSPGGLIREVRGQCGAILKVGEVIDVYERGYRVAVLADSDWAVASPRLGDEFSPMLLGRC